MITWERNLNDLDKVGLCACLDAPMGVLLGSSVVGMASGSDGLHPGTLLSVVLSGCFLSELQE